MLIAAAIWLPHRCTAEKRIVVGAEEVSAQHDAENTGTALTDPSSTAASPGSTAIQQRLGEVFAGIGKNLSSAGQAEETTEVVLRCTLKYMLDMQAREAASAILQRLESGEDAETGLRFQVGEDGLAAWPTWRVYLLDLLGSINPKMAADYARRNIFVRYDSADEWAVAMRSVLASTPPSRQVVAQEEISVLLSRMLAQPRWREAATDGMCEAVDFIAHTPDPAIHLAAMQRWATEKKDGSIDAALQIAAERATTETGGRLIFAIAANPDLLASTPSQCTLRASVMARANLGQAEQNEAVRSYLVRIDPQGEEAAAFFAVFPNHRFSVASGLAASPVLPTAGEMRASDEAALRKMAVWKADPGLAPHVPSIQILENKLGRMLHP